MIIDVICNDGSPLNTHVSDVYGESGRIGLGGAELALMTLCEGLHNRGHLVRLFNNPTFGTSPFPQYNLTSFNPQSDRDILLVFRSPNKRVDGAKGLKVWWSCDQQTCGEFKPFSLKMDKIVTISPFHAQYFQTRYGIEHTITIDLPVRSWDYTEKPEKIPHRMIFCSVPDRGLEILAAVYGDVVRAVPDVSLVITSDYRLWGSVTARNESHIGRFLGHENVRFLGAIPRREMVKEQLLADIQSYPCSYEELFCYSVAECSIAGAYPITSSMGALETTNMGAIVDGFVLFDPTWKSRFTDTLIEHLVDPMLSSKQKILQKRAMDRFSIEKIIDRWEKEVFNVA